jgi:ribonucleoside-diphosphate reductase alpha chain
MGHVKMMAAAQPFLSGAISKTVNMPTEATVEDIAEVYREAWHMGLKALAIYRDGCKRSQPLSSGKEESKADIATGPAIPVEGYRPATLEDLVEAAKGIGAQELGEKLGMVVRKRLPDERAAITHKFSIGGHEGYITVGLFEDGQPGELFCTMSKEGSTISGLMDAFATAISLSLQYGVPLKVLVEKFSHTRFEPSGFTGNPHVPIAKSVTDYIFRWLGQKFLPDADKPHDPTTNQTEMFDGAEVKKGPDAESAVDKMLETAQKIVLGTAESAEPETVKASSTAQEKREKHVFSTQADAPPCHD